MRKTGIYFEDQDTFRIRDIVKATEILAAFPNTEIYSLKVMYNDELAVEKRDLMTASMVQRCSNLTTLYMGGFTYENFHADEFGKSKYDFARILPKLTDLTLDRSNMPLSELKSLKTIVHLAIIFPPVRFLWRDFLIHPVTLPLLERLELAFDIIPPGYSDNFLRYFPIRMGSVKILDISDSLYSKMEVYDLIALSTTWMNVEHLKMDIQKAFSIVEIHQLITNMPNVQHIDAVTILATTTYDEFKNCICNPIYEHLITFRLRGFGTRENRDGLVEFFKYINIDIECGSIFYPPNDHEEPYFVRNQR